jgi:hypothetical protein
LVCKTQRKSPVGKFRHARENDVEIYVGEGKRDREGHNERETQLHTDIHKLSNNCDKAIIKYFNIYLGN